MFANGISHGFKRVELQDWKLLQEYFEKADFQESNHNIINLLMWNEVFPVWFKEGYGWLIIVGIHKGEWFLYMPLCPFGCIIEAIHTGEQLFDAVGIPYVMSCYIKEEKDKILELDSAFKAEAIRDGYDYIYEYEKLATFTGKKLQKKRNHLNAFMKEYEGRYAYSRMQKSDIDDCLLYLSEWENNEDDEFLIQECAGVRFLLQHFDELPYVGGVVRIDGKIKGFTIGSRLNHDTVQINVEKAEGDIRGLYPFLTKSYLANEWNNQGIVWVNREDDMGKENIRKAKEALYPAYLLEKYRIYK